MPRKEITKRKTTSPQAKRNTREPALGTRTLKAEDMYHDLLGMQRHKENLAGEN